MSAASRRASAAADRELLSRATWRLGLQIGVLFFVCLTVVSVIVVVTVLRGQQEQTIGLLDGAILVSHGSQPDRDRDDRPDLGSVSVAVADPSGFRVSAGMPAGLPERSVMETVARTGATIQRTVEIGGRYYAVRTARHGDDTVQAVIDLTEEREQLTRLLQAIALAGGAGMILAAGGSAWLARRAVRPMSDALALQRRFVADASHELRTPLTLLSTRVQLMARRLHHSPDVVDVKAIEKDATGLIGDAANLTAILEDLLAAADSGSTIQAEPVDVAAVSHEAVAAAEAFAAECEIDIVYRAQAPARVEAASRTGLLRAATALLDNAISHARRTVTFEVSVGPRDVVMEIGDDGAGIAADAGPTMFERFSSSRESNDGVRRHYGLGLAIVAEIAHAHGGTIAAANRAVGTGAVLTMRIPRNPSRR